MNAHIAREHDNLQSRRARENIALLEPLFCEGFGDIAAGTRLGGGDRRAQRGFRLRIGGLVRFIQLAVNRRIDLVSEGALQILQRDERVASVARRGKSKGRKDRQGKDGREKRCFFHASFSSVPASAEVLEMR